MATMKNKILHLNISADRKINLVKLDVYLHFFSCNIIQFYI